MCELGNGSPRRGCKKRGFSRVGQPGGTVRKEKSARPPGLVCGCYVAVHGWLSWMLALLKLVLAASCAGLAVSEASPVVGW